MQSKSLLPAILSFCSVVGLSSVVQARVSAVYCDEYVDVVQSRCPRLIGSTSSCASSSSRSVRMNCEGASGYIDNETKLSSLGLLITNPRTRKREIVHLNIGKRDADVAGPIKNYYNIPLRENRWVMDQLAEKDIILDREDQIEVAEGGYGLRNDTYFYSKKDLLPSSRMGTIRDIISNNNSSPTRNRTPSSTRDLINCRYIGYDIPYSIDTIDIDPYLISNNGCGTTQLCASYVQCDIGFTREGRNAYSNFASCSRLRNGKCPTAIDCIHEVGTKVDRGVVEEDAIVAQPPSWPETPSRRRGRGAF